MYKQKCTQLCAYKCVWERGDRGKEREGIKREREEDKEREKDKERERKLKRERGG